MKTLRKILFVVITIIAIILIIPLFVSGDYRAEREVKINRNVSEVFDYVKHLKNQDKYGVWAKKDPAMAKDYKGTDGTVGFISAWKSDKKDVGRGEQEIIMIDPGKRVEMELRFYEPFESTDFGYLTTEAVNDSVTLVKWGFYGKMKYPMNVMTLFMDMETMIGTDLQNGLNNLKVILEKE
ncbi:MAG: SRPBCC family protein [Bacteroidales bacterium]|jgi:hypothetical protein|nr:SRPBCC family protein [Bacteroidales bacterium]